jgi:replication initiation and membrane attachment protein
MKSTILPADKFIVINKTIFNDQDRKLLMRLYQPIIGSDAVSLYFNLWSELDKMEFTSEEYTHHYLMNLLGFSIDGFVLAKAKLEAVGLIRTYVKEDSINSYIYELYSPLYPNDFFSNPILSTLLLSNIGKREYDIIVKNFKMPSVSLKEYKEVTSSFSDVFMVSNVEKDYSTLDLRSRSTNNLAFDIGFDLEECLASIPSEMLNLRSVNKGVRELLLKLAFIYDFNLETMSEVIKESLNEKNAIDKEKIRENARKYYTFQNSGKLPNIIFKCQPEYLRKPIGDNTKMAQLIYMFETTSPYNFLASKIGTKPSKTDLKVLEHLAVDIDLTPGVINVLLDFVLKTTNNKLNMNYIDAIASQWKRSRIMTVEDAIKIARSENNKRKPKTKVAVEPTWFDQKIETIVASDEEKKDIDELLKEFS